MFPRTTPTSTYVKRLYTGGVRRRLRAVSWVVLAANFVDVTTSLLPSFADHMAPLAPRGAVAWAVQLAGVALFVGLGARHVPRLARALGGLPIPRPALGVLGAFYVVFAGHVALRLENYPFSPAAMFSGVVVGLSSDNVSTRLVMVIYPEGLDAPGFLHEGASPWTARHRFVEDYKVGWLLRLNSANFAAVYEHVGRALDAEGFSRHRIVPAAYNARTGRLVRQAAPP